MFLIHLLKILFWVLIVRHAIRWVSYHINNKNKKARIFHGNCRMPKEVALALTELMNRRENFYNLINTAPGEGYINTSEESNRINQQYISGNGKQKQFPLFKTGNNRFIGYSKLRATSKLLAKNYNVVSTFLLKDKMSHLTFLKNSETITQNPKNSLACPR
jgi:hypothetical protein